MVRAATVTTLYNVLSPGECRALIEQAEALGFHPEDRPVDPLHRQPSPSSPVADRIDVQDPLLVQRLLDRLSPWLPTAEGTLMGLDGLLRLHRYTAPQRMKAMKDPLSDRVEASHRLTLLLHLNHDCQGGSLMFPNGATVSPLAGTAVWFHPQDRAQGEPVFGGTHYVLRADVLYREKEALAA